jgi:chromosome segregation ATPase
MLERQVTQLENKVRNCEEVSDVRALQKDENQALREEVLICQDRIYEMQQTINSYEQIDIKLETLEERNRTLNMEKCDWQNQINIDRDYYRQTHEIVENEKFSLKDTITSLKREMRKLFGFNYFISGRTATS